MKTILLDGSMGTMLQAAGLAEGESPEDWNLDHPDTIKKIHAQYLDAGADIIYTNTFGANPLKYRGKYTLGQVVSSALDNAREAIAESGRKARIALDIGPTGRMLKPAGDCAFEEAYAAFAETVRLGRSAADLIVVETMTDTQELRAAVIAAKENSELPVFASVALGEDGRLLTGGKVETVVAILECLGVEALGFNCGMDPNRLAPFVERMRALADLPIIVKANAGLPKVVDGKTVFTVGPDDFAAAMENCLRAGATIIGGCCGTTPAHIAALHRAVTTPPDHSVTSLPRHSVICSGSKILDFSASGLIIGERINPTGKKKLKEAYRTGDTAYILREAVSQIDSGAAILDVNAGVPGIDEAATLASTISEVQSVTDVPLEIDTSDPAALERALRIYNGKALVNSVNGKRESMDAVFPLVKKYGGMIVALCLDEQGIPDTPEGRLKIARQILDEGAKYGFDKDDFLFDALTLSVSTDPKAAVTTLETVRRLTEELGVKTVLGVSNVSFGLPNRPALNNAMYALAKRAGLTAAIANPSVIRDEIVAGAEEVLLGRDEGCRAWIAANASTTAADVAVTTSPCLSAIDLSAAIIRGLKIDAATAAMASLTKLSPLEVIEKEIVPALETVGAGFEKGTVYLPQLLMAADAAGEAFGVVRKSLGAAERIPQGPAAERIPPPLRGKIVLATVKGDIHDIGKNIVRALLENYGFDVIDLGRDVPPEKIVAAAKESGAKLVGLSALMTTTVGAMSETVRMLKASGLSVKTVVGGAVVTQEYADEIGADYYAKDAMRTVRIAEALCKCHVSIRLNSRSAALRMRPESPSRFVVCRMILE